MTAADSDLDRMLRAHRRPTGPVTDQMPKCWCCGRVLGTYSTRPWSRKCVNQCDKVILESEFLATKPGLGWDLAQAGDKPFYRGVLAGSRRLRVAPYLAPSNLNRATVP